MPKYSKAYLKLISGYNSIFESTLRWEKTYSKPTQRDVSLRFYERNTIVACDFSPWCMPLTL